MVATLLARTHPAGFAECNQVKARFHLKPVSKLPGLVFSRRFKSGTGQVCAHKSPDPISLATSYNPPLQLNTNHIGLFQIVLVVFTSFLLRVVFAFLWSRSCLSSFQTPNGSHQGSLEPAALTLVSLSDFMVLRWYISVAVLLCFRTRHISFFSLLPFLTLHCIRSFVLPSCCTLDL